MALSAKRGNHFGIVALLFREKHQRAVFIVFDVGIAMAGVAIQTESCVSFLLHVDACGMASGAAVEKFILIPGCLIETSPFDLFLIGSKSPAGTKERQPAISSLFRHPDMIAAANEKFDIF